MFQPQFRVDTIAPEIHLTVAVAPAVGTMNASSKFDFLPISSLPEIVTLSLS
jgi:hypothetical protein